MLMLGIDSSAQSAAVALCDQNRTIADFKVPYEKTHSEKLLMMVDMTLKAVGIGIEEIDCFAAVSGPGSFTGLRIGLATVKAMAQAGGGKVYLTTSLNALYFQARISEALDSEGGLGICPIMDARRGDVYGALFENGKRLIPEGAYNLRELIDNLKEFNKKILFTGDGVIPYREIIKQAMPDTAFFAEEPFLAAGGAAVIRAALWDSNPIDYEQVNPSYFKLSQAERLKAKDGRI